MYNKDKKKREELGYKYIYRKADHTIYNEHNNT